MNNPTESDSSGYIKPASSASDADNQEALRQSEEKYRTLFNSIDQGCYLAEVIFDTNGEAIDVFYIDANPASTGMAGEDFTGKFLRDLRPDHGPYWYKVFGRVAKTGNPERMEKYVAPDHVLYDYLVFKIGSSGYRIAVIFQDVTERARREVNQAFLAKITLDLSRLLTLEEIIATVSTRIGMYLELKSCMFVDVDDARGEATVFGSWTSPDVPDLQNRTIRFSEYVDDEFSRASRLGDDWVVRDTLSDPRTKDAGFRELGIGAFVSVPFHRNGVWTNYIAISDVKPRKWRADEVELVRDLCNRIFPRLERARTEQNMRRLEERTRIAIEAAEMATWEWDLVTDQVYWNEQHFRLLGIPIHENTGHQPNEPLPSDAFMRHIHPEDLEHIQGDLTRAIEEKGIYDADFRIVRMDGMVRWMSGYGRITAESDGKATRFNGVMFDIHERKQAEEALIQADKNKDVFLATLAHELRNPLAPIRNMLQILYLTAGENQTVNAAVDLMNRQVDQLVHLVDDLLDVSRISRGTIQLQPGIIDLNDVVQAAIETVAPLYNDGQRVLKVTVPPTHVLVHGDMTRLIQVINNLLNNAAKFSFAGGTVDLIVKTTDLIAILLVRDNGIGILEQDLERIFDLFTQADASLEKSYGGLGLGLTLVRQLVELHGGTVTASSPGQNLGSTFTVHLPLMTAIIPNGTTDGQ